MKRKKISALIMAIMVFLTLIQPYTLAADAVTFTAVDGTPGNDNEDYPNLFDGKKSKENPSKYCITRGSASETYVVAQASEPIVVTGYTFTTGNDNTTYRNRNPKSWVLYGSNTYDKAAENTWTEIDTVTGDTSMKDENWASFNFTCSNQTAYTYYKFKFTETQGSNEMQLSEIEFTYSVEIHDWEEISRTEPTCAVPGKIDQKCTDCGITRTVEIPVIDHNWEETSRTEPACFDEGKIVEECSSCHKEKETILYPLGHIKGDNDKDCGRCGKPVIEVGGKYYFDLQTAVNSAVLNVPVTLLQDVAISNTLSTAQQRTVNLNGFTIKQTGNDRAIKVVNEFTLTDSSENHTGKIIGGGIYVTPGATFHMSGGTISGCSAENGSGIYVDQGATLNMSGNAAVSDCYGGGIHVDTGATLNMSGNAAVSGCHDSGIYGASSATLNMSGNAAVRNCTAENGGGIYASSGAILNMSDNAAIRDCTAENNGGGVYLNYGTVKTDKGTIENCKASFGGGIYVCGKGTKLELSNLLIKKCTATQAGGGVCASDRSISLANSQIEENTAINGGGILAAGIPLNTLSLEITGSTIQKNTADNDGGGVYANNRLIISITNSQIAENTANNGGGINTLDISDFKINGSTIQKNIANAKGGGIRLEKSTLTMTDTDITKNTTTGDGGGIYALTTSSIIFDSGSIDGNSAAWGGGVYLHYGSDITISAGNIKNNTAINNGGGVIINDSKRVYTNGKWTEIKPTLTMTGGSISHNETTNTGDQRKDGNGGGICGQKKAVINISGGTIGSNTAINSGGAICLLDNSAATVTGGTISDNIARTGNGGAIWANNTSSLNLAGGLILDNHAIGLGGGIYSDSSNFTVANDPHVMRNYISKYVVDDTGYGYPEPMHDNNTYLTSGKKISGSLKEVDAPPMIYVTLADTTQDITGEFDSDCSSYIHYDDNKFAVVYDEQSKTHKLAESVLITLIEIEGETEESRYDYAAKGRKYTPSYEPWRAGYRFLGWCKDGIMYDFSQPINEPLTLTAKWTEYGNAFIYLTEDGYTVSGPFGTGVICLASYDNSGALLDTAIAEVSEGAGQQLFSDINFVTEGAAKISAFMWNKNMNPLCDKATIKLTDSDNTAEE